MSYNAAAQRVPAWKRLGLKLKGPASGEDPVSSISSGNVAGSANSTPASQQRNGPNSLNASPASALKRKQYTPLQTPNKKLRLDEQTPSGSSALKKSVTFAEDTKETEKIQAAKKAKAAAKKKKAPKKVAEAKVDFSLDPALAYLRQWHTDRGSWKFNKNHQTLLIKYLFDAEKVPSSEIPIFYEYIRDLKGAVRTRLRETAQEMKKEDMEKGAAAFASSVKDKEAKQQEYQEAVAEFIQKQQELREQRIQDGANGKRSFDEAELVIRLANPEVKQRLLKRVRAEMVLDELSDSESTTSTDTTMTGTSTTSSTAQKEATAGAEPAATAKSNDGSLQPAKRRRLRKVRTQVDDDESSDDSSSGDDSDASDDDDVESKGNKASSSSSSSDDESDEDMGTPAALDDNESSSSSSSSSGSDSESGGSDDENDSGSDGSDDSDDED